MPVLRPWLAALALVVCLLIALAVYAWSVDFRAPEVVSGLGEAAAMVRLQATAMALHLEAAEMHRREVRRMRDAGEAAATLQAARFALADELRAAALLAQAEGDPDRAGEWLAEASRAAPERVDLICLMTDLRTRAADIAERRVELLLLVLRYDSPCANLLVGESFLEADDADAARGYLQRAAKASPQWSAPHLALARLHMLANKPAAAQASGQQALANARGLHSRLNAAAVIRRAGGVAPERWRLIVEWAWRTYAWVLPVVGVFVVLLASPALVRLGRRGVAWARSQRGMAESAS